MKLSCLAAALVIACLLVVPAVHAQQQPFYFGQDSKVMFLGDSITEQYQYSSVVEYYLWTRYPAKPWHFLNAGISGQTAGGEAKRFANDVAPEQFGLCTFDYGMNDGGYRAFEQGIQDNYLSNMRQLLELCPVKGSRVLVMSPNPCDARAKPGLADYVAAQERYYAAALDMAKQMGFTTVDQFGPTKAALDRLYADKAEVRPFPDGVHTSWPGALLMAHSILTGLKAPAAVSSAGLMVAGGGARLGGAAGCTISNLSFANGVLSFERKDAALPMAIPPEWRPILPYVNNLSDLNVLELKVTGLPEGKYALQMGMAKNLATYTAAELAQGVNLGLLSAGPLYDQGIAIWQAMGQKNNTVHSRFREVVMFDVDGLPGWIDKAPIKQARQQQLDQRLQQIQEAEGKLHDLCQPQAYRVILAPAP